MLKRAAGGVLWMARGTATMIGLAVMLAVVLGVGATALAAVPGDPLKLGKTNAVNRLTTLVKRGPGPALALRVRAGHPPLAVNSNARVANLNAASAGQADRAANAQNAANADKVDQVDSAALLPGGDLPRGRTVRGNYDIIGTAPPSTFSSAADSISFGYRLASAPTVRFVKANTAPPAECPGSVGSPEAAPGYLCVYELSASTTLASGYPQLRNATRQGAGIIVYTPFTNSVQYFYTYGTWAVTGN